MRIDRRGVVATILALVYPGLGHVYLRTWLRAIGWFGLAVAAAALVVPESAYAAYQQGGFDALYEASKTFGNDVVLSILGVRLLNAVDAYLTALKQSSAKSTSADGGCPHCGKELDEELDFCPWCTARLEPERDEEDEPPATTSR